MSKNKNPNNLKTFFIKLISITFAIIVIINVTYNLILADKLENINSLLQLNKKENIELIKNKVRHEIERGIKKDKILNEEDKILLYKLYKKLRRVFRNRKLTSNFKWSNLTKNYIYNLNTFSSYCAVSIGFSWDEGFLIKQGKSTANYLLSLGTIDPKDIFRREFYSPIYYSLKYLITQIFPTKYHIEAGHLVNLFFSIAAIVGLKKLCENLFNKKTGIIAFLILFFYPAFFGHMGFNSKDTIIAFCNIWIFYYIIKNIFKRENKFIFYIDVLSAVGTGLNLFFLVSVIPIIIFFVIELFLIIKFNKELNKKRIYISLIKGF